MNNYEKLKQAIQQANPEIIVEYYNRCMNCGFGFSHCQCGDKRISQKAREIRLADVLLAIKMIRHWDWTDYSFEPDGGFFDRKYGGRFHWNLKDDNLDNESEETKQFLIDLLTSN